MNNIKMVVCLLVWSGIVWIPRVFGLSDQQTCFEPLMSTNMTNNDDNNFLNTMQSGVQLLFPDFMFKCNGHVTGIEILVQRANHTLTRSLFFQVWEPNEHSYRIKTITKILSNTNTTDTYERVSKSLNISVGPGDIIGMYVAHTVVKAPYERPLTPLYSTVDNNSINASTVYQANAEFPPCDAFLCSSEFQLLNNIKYKLEVNYSASDSNGTMDRDPSEKFCRNLQVFTNCPNDDITTTLPSIPSSSIIVYSTSTLNGSSFATTPTCSSEPCNDTLFAPLPVLVVVPSVIIIIALFLLVLAIVIFILYKKKVIQKSTEQVHSSSIEHYQANNGSVYATVSIRKGSKHSMHEQQQTDIIEEEDIDGLQPYAELRTVLTTEPVMPFPLHKGSIVSGSIPTNLSANVTNSIPPYAAASMFDTRFVNHRSATLSLSNSPMSPQTSSMMNIGLGRRATVSGGSPFKQTPHPYMLPLPKQNSTNHIFSFKDRLPSKSSPSEVASPSSIASPFLPSVGEDEVSFSVQPYQEPKMAINEARISEQKHITGRGNGSRKMSVPNPELFANHRVLKKANSIDFASPYLVPSPTLKAKRRYNLAKMTTETSSAMILPRITNKGSLMHLNNHEEYARLDRPNTAPREPFIHPPIPISPPSDSLYDTAHPQQKYREISKDNISIGKKLGSGHFGTVYSGVWNFDGGHLEVAFKILKPGLGQIEREKFLHEAEIMGQFLHQNVVKLHGVISIGEPLMICLELMLKGDLKHYLKEMKSMHHKIVKNQTEYARQFLSFCRQVADGMSYLASKDFVHRDLAARNIFLNDKMICKIGDFGMSRGLAHDEIYESKGCDIPLRWTAPEAVKYLMYTIASDVWSYGILLFEIWSIGCKPFHSNTVDEIRALISSQYCLPPPPGCPRYIYKLMVDCWNHDKSGRPTFLSIVDILSKHDSTILEWNSTDFSVSEMCTLLGAPLEEGKYLFPDLQDYYTNHLI